MLVPRSVVLLAPLSRQLGTFNPVAVLLQGWLPSSPSRGCEPVTKEKKWNSYSSRSGSGLVLGVNEPWLGERCKLLSFSLRREYICCGFGEDSTH
jgi:hypothetical protein